MGKVKACLGGVAAYEVGKHAKEHHDKKHAHEHHDKHCDCKACKK